LIDASVTSDEVDRGRPHPDMIRRLMLKLDFTDPRRIAKVGDTPADLLEGKNAGCGLVIGVTQGSCARDQLERFPHDYLIGSVAELPELLGV
jgi:Predicted phosphatases